MNLLKDKPLPTFSSEIARGSCHRLHHISYVVVALQGVKIAGTPSHVAYRIFLHLDNNKQTYCDSSLIGMYVDSQPSE